MELDSILNRACGERLHDLHLGGAKDGVSATRKELSKGELERLSWEYICGICNIIGSQKEATKAKGWV